MPGRAWLQSAGVGGSAGGSSLSRVPGLIEAIPERVFHASPYNDWPLFELHVHEGQRLKFRRENGRWTGDGSLFTQFETPAEIESRTEEVAIAESRRSERRRSHATSLREELAREC